MLSMEASRYGQEANERQDSTPSVERRKKNPQASFTPTPLAEGTLNADLTIKQADPHSAFTVPAALRDPEARSQSCFRLAMPAVLYLAQAISREQETFLEHSPYKLDLLQMSQVSSPFDVL